MTADKQEKIAVIGLGYVGLPAAIAFSEKFTDVIGFDTDQRRIQELNENIDSRGEIASQQLADASVKFTSNPDDLASTSFFVVAVPTPVDENRQPDLTAIRAACELLGPRLSKGDLVVFESTVWPGVTEEICGPDLAASSGLKQGRDFFLAYSPERINPGDRKHQFQNVVKVIAAENESSAQRVANIYEQVVNAGIFMARSIKVAEAAKLIENTQRDLNIALMNELAIIFDRLDIATADVLAAAKTKWNFLPFTPGLVGGHCIGVDPYYLSSKAKQSGHYPQLVLTARRINDGMSSFIANKLVKMMIAAEVPVKGANVAVLGITFKENVADIRNSRVPEIIRELQEFGINVQVVDPHVDPDDLKYQYDIALVSLAELDQLDGVIITVPHDRILEELDHVLNRLKENGVVIDVKTALQQNRLPVSVKYWSL
ncbi:MAG: nucleotide sugar dehydrogenase [Gammaproteobacteria bacterium]